MFAVIVVSLANLIKKVGSNQLILYVYRNCQMTDKMYGLSTGASDISIIDLVKEVRFNYINCRLTKPANKSLKCKLTD